MAVPQRLPEQAEGLAFGPVPSRRLGRSLGVNTIPPKVCSYGCIYCQVGVTDTKQMERRPFFAPQQIADAAAARLEEVRARGEAVDYLTIVPDGEPTLDVRLGESIGLLRRLGVPVAVISNGSLLWDADTRADLAEADWVSVKMDAATEEVWRRVNHPHPGLALDRVLAGIARFTAEFDGILCTETMLVSRVNDSAASVGAVADILGGMPIDVAYLAVPTRPPAMPGVRAARPPALNRAYQIFSDRLAHVEYLVGFEGEFFSTTDDVVRDLLATSAVHPLRESAVAAMLASASAPWRIVNELVSAHQLRRVSYGGEQYYLRAYDS